MTDRPTAVLELRSVRGTGGGPEKTILFGAARHDRRFAITVCYVRDLRDDVFGIDGRARDLDLDYVEVRERHSFDPGIWGQLVELARERRFDIIHGHDYKTNLLAWLLARRTGAVPVATSHGWTGHTARERWLYYPADRQVLRRMPRVIAVSSRVRDQLTQAGADPERVIVLLNGIDPETFRRDAARRDRVRRELGIDPGERAIGAVGRLEPQKRFDLLLEAFAGVRRTRPDLRLMVAGDGSQLATLTDLAATLGLGDRVQWLGHRLDVADLHDAFDLFVQSSEYEGTPNAVLEAMAMDTPIVATDVGGTSALARPGEHALIVPPDDRNALERAFAAAHDDPSAAWRRAVAARRRVEVELSFAERTRRLEAVYDDLMGERDRGRRPPVEPEPVGAPHA
jgi:glycosyltransferase involved in cell wall biosynthesis